MEHAHRRHSLSNEEKLRLWCRFNQKSPDINFCTCVTFRGFPANVFSRVPYISRLAELRLTEQLYAKMGDCQ
jgi:hypothetical protein